ncbi:type IV pilus assembly protein PilM [Candidatus Microgenomates bacterium]|nr:type IV pilus assembly protein PilM [Candidatus Microgenomates bacterium]
MDVFGLDLGSSLIKAVQLKNIKGKITLVGAGSISTPPKGLISDSPLDQEAVVQAVKKLLSETKISADKVNAALPDSKVFSRIIELPILSDQELEDALQWEAEQYIPFPLEEVNLDFSTIEKNEETKKMQVLVVAAPIRLVNKYANILKSTGLSTLALETEIIAVSRLISTQISGDKTAMVINLGSDSTAFSILKKGSFSFVGSISTGGKALARAVAQELGFDIERAEEYKRTYGLEKESLEGKVLIAIKPLIDKVVQEIRKAISFYHQENPHDQISNLILTGGTAYLPGIASYLTQNLEVETQINNPWAGIVVDEKKFAHLMDESVLFAAATGLALRNL